MPPVFRHPLSSNLALPSAFGAAPAAFRSLLYSPAMDWMHLVYYVALIALLFTGLFVNLLGLPGLWLMLASVAGYAVVTGWNRYVGWASLVTLLVLALLAEVVEFLAGSAGAKKAGGSKRGMIGAIVGGLLGGFFLTFIPIPIVSTIVGVCLGTFLGAWGAELMVGKEMDHSMQIGWGAAKGRLVGTLLKTMFGVAMLLVAMVAAWPSGAANTAGTTTTVTTTAPAAPVTPATQAATAPASAPTSAPAMLPEVEE